VSWRASPPVRGDDPDVAVPVKGEPLPVGGQGGLLARRIDSAAERGEGEDKANAQSSPAVHGVPRSVVG